MLQLLVTFWTYFTLVLWQVYNALSFTVTATITLNVWTAFTITLVVSAVVLMVVRYRFLNRYTTLKQVAHVFHPSVTIDESPDRDQGYPDDFMNAFLSSIKIFGYLDRPVFHELARHLETKKLCEGDILFDENTVDRDFYVVVSGCVQLFVKGTGEETNEIVEQRGLSSSSQFDYEDDLDSSPVPGYHLLNEVEAGGTVSSLFTILSVFTEDLELPSQLGSQNLPVLKNRVLKDLDKDVMTESPAEPDFEDSKHPPVVGKDHAPLKEALRNVTERSEDKSDSETPELIIEENTIPEEEHHEEMGGPVFPSLKPTDSPASSFKLPPTSKHAKDLFPKVKPEKKSRSIHPHMVARASKDTTLAVIPAEAFRKLTNKFPNSAAHIAQVILTRFQRVTFLTLYRYLGLSKELLRIEKHVNDFSGFGLPADLFPPAAVHALRFGDMYNDPVASTPKQPGRKSNDPFFKKRPSISTQKINMIDEDAEERIRDAVFQSFARILGMTSEPPQNQTLNAVTSNTSLHPENDGSGEFLGPRQSTFARAERIYYGKSRRGSVYSTSASNPTPSNLNPNRPPLAGRKAYMDDDLESSFSRASSQMSDEDSAGAGMTDHGDIQIINYSTGHMLIREGQRNSGLYFVIDGILEASVEQNGFAWNMMSSGNHSTAGSASSADSPTNRSRSLFLIRPGGLAGYLASLTGNSSFVNIIAKTDVIVGFMPKEALDRYVEKYPSILLYLAKRLVDQLPPLVLHIDVALEWGQINAGQALCRQNDPSSAIYIVLTGRLRSLMERKVGNETYVDVVGEFGQGESVGEMEVLMGTPRPGTIHAIRDSEVAIMPKTLFNVLSIRHPEITLAISRIIAVRSTRSAPSESSLLDPLQHNSLNFSANMNLKTVAIVPVNQYVPVGEFSDKLLAAVKLIGGSVTLLNTAGVTSQLGKHVFTRLGKLKLLSWLAEQEDIHRLVLYIADGGVTAPWTQRCIRQADCILLVGLGDHDSELGEYERLLVSMKATARKELVLLHAQRVCIPGSTGTWLKKRPWIQAHHHVQMAVATMPLDAGLRKPQTLINIKNQVERYYNRSVLGTMYKRSGLSDGNSRNSPTIFTGVRSDFARLARRLLSKSIGVALGGGGARGVSHVGILRAFEEAGIPIDMIGGTSIGAFVGGLYARENDHVSVFGRCKMMSARIVSTWRNLLDLTYPIVALVTGHEFNRGIFKSFVDTQIEDCWIPYFAVTTNITWSRMEVHRMGYMWRYVRASMSLAGLLPPLCDDGNMLMDGGYLNNLPADVIRSLGAQSIVAVDVGLEDDTAPVTYGDTISGWWLILRRFNPFSKNYGRIPTTSEIQLRLAYVSSVKQREDVKRMDGCIYIHPPVSKFSVMEFGNFAEIYEVGYAYGKEIVDQWRRDGTLLYRFGVASDDGVPDRKAFHGRRASV